MILLSSRMSSSGRSRSLSAWCTRRTFPCKSSGCPLVRDHRPHKFFRSPYPRRWSRGTYRPHEVPKVSRRPRCRLYMPMGAQGIYRTRIIIQHDFRLNLLPHPQHHRWRKESIVRVIVQRADDPC